MPALTAFKPETLVGRSLQSGRYVLTHFLGQGSFAWVYRAREMLNGAHLRDVAVKWVVEGDAEQLLKEARALAAMPPHQNIVSFLTCLPVAPPATGMLLVLEFVDGQPMAQLMADGRTQDAIETARMMGHILAGLAHAHAHQVVHRDLKPENVMARNDGTLKITDFGIARSASSGKGTSSDVIKGTPAYMAPEQFGKQHDHRVDLYAAGVMAFELLVGRRPFEGTPAEIMRSHMMDPPPIPANLPWPLTEFLYRALAKEPDDRFQDAVSMCQALAQAAGAPAAVLPQERPVPVHAKGSAAGTVRKPAETSVRARRHEARASQDTALELRDEPLPPASQDCPEALTERSWTELVVGRTLPHQPLLAARVASELAGESATRMPIYRLKRATCHERRRVVESREPYRGQALPGTPRLEAAEADAWGSAVELERSPSAQEPFLETRLAGTERLEPCGACSEQGQLACQECHGRGCGKCSGLGHVSCDGCAGTGRQLAFLVVQAEYESTHLVELKHPAALSCPVDASDVSEVPGEPLMRLARRHLGPENLPEPFPWPELTGPVRKALTSLELPESAAPLSDELRLEWFWSVQVVCRLGPRQGSLTLVPGTGVCRAEPRLLEAVRSRARELLREPAAWARAPRESLGFGREALLAPEAVPGQAEVQQSAFELARRLMEEGQTSTFRELRRAFAEIVSRDRKGEWKARWATLLGQHRQRLVARFRDLLERAGPPAEATASLAELAELDLLGVEGASLWNLALGHISTWVRAGDLERSDAYVAALSTMDWPVPGARQTLLALSRDALDGAARSVLERLEAGGAPADLIDELSCLVATCPRLSGLPATLRAFRRRLFASAEPVSLLAACRLCRRLHDELAQARPELAGLFANSLEGNEETYLDACARALRDAGSQETGLELLHAATGSLEGHPRVPLVEDALDQVMTRTLAERCLPEAQRHGLLPEEVERETRRLLGTWLRVQAWCPQQRSPPAFVEALWAVLEVLLHGMLHDRAQPLLDLVASISAVAAHPRIGPLAARARQQSLERETVAAVDGLRTRGDFEAFLATLAGLAELVPRHRCVASLMDGLEAHCRGLSRGGDVAAVLERCRRGREALGPDQRAERPWLERPADHFRTETEQSLAAALEQEDGGLDRALTSLAKLRAAGVSWVEDAAALVERAAAHAKDPARFERKLGLLAVSLVEAATSGGSELRQRLQEAREATDRKMRRLGGAVMLALAFEVLPHLMTRAGVPPLDHPAATRAGILSWLAMLVGGWGLSALVAPMTRLTMDRLDPRGKHWGRFAAASGAALSALVFGLGAALAGLF